MRVCAPALACVCALAAGCVTSPTPIAYAPRPDRVVDARADVDSALAALRLTTLALLPLPTTEVWHLATTWGERTLTVRWVHDDGRVLGEDAVVALDHIDTVEVGKAGTVYVVHVGHDDDRRDVDCMVASEADAVRLADALTRLKVR